eukprot:m.50059 g.50059  ORF g.50059 m.50059 type:complete len:643 (-) comp10645_c0_seq1:233-2161(-)
MKTFEKLALGLALIVASALVVLSVLHAESPSPSRHARGIQSSLIEENPELYTIPIAISETQLTIVQCNKAIKEVGECNDQKHINVPLNGAGTTADVSFIIRESRCTLSWLSEGLYLFQEESIQVIEVSLEFLKALLKESEKTRQGKKFLELVFATFVSLFTDKKLIFEFAPMPFSVAAELLQGLPEVPLVFVYQDTTTSLFELADDDNCGDYLSTPFCNEDDLKSCVLELKGIRQIPLQFKRENAIIVGSANVKTNFFVEVVNMLIAKELPQNERLRKLILKKKKKMENLKIIATDRMGSKLVHSDLAPYIEELKDQEHDIRTFAFEAIPRHENTISEYIPYPKLQNLTFFLNRWPPDDPNVPDVPGIEKGTLEKLDFQNPKEKRRATVLRLHEVPFLLYNVPEINRVHKLWTDAYLSSRIGTQDVRVMVSNSNHFPYYNGRLARRNKHYKPPWTIKKMPFAAFLKMRNELENLPVKGQHVYYKVDTSRGHNSWIEQDIPIFSKKENFFVPHTDGHEGVHCRLGTRGVISEPHFDGGRNFITMIQGAKRYILLPPEECLNMYMYREPHPEARHAKFDWSEFNISDWPDMKKAKAIEVIIRAGEVLYLPSYWNHYIASTGKSLQCNVRSGLANRGEDEIDQCT